MTYWRRLWMACLLPFCLAPSGVAQVIDYDAGIITIEGVQIFQDAQDPNKFYYLPRYPKLSSTEAGEFELLLMKVVGADTDQLGGIFHALVEFDLPDDVLEAVRLEFSELRPTGELVGALPLYEPDEEDAYGSFRVVSATLSENGEMTNRLLSSGPAPLRAGSKAAIAARLTPEESTILMDSFTGTTSDVSVSIRGYYEAKVKGYNATVTANMDTIYGHRSVVDSFQRKYTRRQVRRIVDDLQQDGALDVQVYDRSQGLNIPTEDLNSILNIVTDKLIEVMFDTETGWSQVPEPEEAVAEGQIKGRLEAGWFQKTFMNAQDQPYYTDDQYVVKNVEDRRANSFFLNLSQSTTIRVPFDSSGNLGGFYRSISEEERSRHFRVVVPSEDIERQSRDVLLQVDGEITEGFANNFNNVVVNVRKVRGEDEPEVSKSFTFTPESIASDNGLQRFELFRAGDETGEWAEFEYQTAWNLRGGDDVLRVPANREQWISSRDSAVALAPPLDRKDIQVDIDTSAFAALEIAAAEVQIATTVAGRVKFIASELVRAVEASPTRSVVVYSDPGEDIASRIVWHTKTGRVVSDFELIDGEYKYITAPAAEWLEEQLQ